MISTWQLALTNLTVIPKDERLTCKVCGDKFTSGSRLDSVYCGSVCREIGAAERKREAAQRAKECKRAMSCV